MTSALRTYERTGDSQYLDVFAETFKFLDECGGDHEYDEWYAGVTNGLNPVGRKGAVYHNGRALIECIETLERL